MILIIEREEIELHLLSDEEKKDIERRTSYTNLTEFESFWLKKTGDLIRPKDSEHFWNGNSYCWWERDFDKKGNPVKDHEYSVWLDKLGNCMCEDHDNDQLYRVMF